MAICRLCQDEFFNRKRTGATLCPTCASGVIKPSECKDYKDFLYRNTSHTKNRLISEMIKFFKFTEKDANAKYKEWKEEYLKN